MRYDLYSPEFGHVSLVMSIRLQYLHDLVVPVPLRPAMAQVAISVPVDPTHIVIIVIFRIVVIAQALKDKKHKYHTKGLKFQQCHLPYQIITHVYS